MIKSGGENVFAAEVEAALVRHPSIAAAAVFGIPDPRWGERVAAAVVLHRDVEWGDMERRRKLERRSLVLCRRVDETGSTAVVVWYSTCAVMARRLDA